MFKLPKNAKWVTAHDVQDEGWRFKAVCPTCKIERLFLKGGIGYMCQANCGFGYSLKEPKSDIEEHKIVFQPNEFGHQLDSEKAKQMQKKSVEARKERKSIVYDAQKP